MAFQGFLERFRAGKRQAWTPIKSHGCGLLPALEAHKKPLKWPFRANGTLDRPEKAMDLALGSFCLRWKPIRSHGSGLLGVLGVWRVLGLANGKLGRP